MWDSNSLYCTTAHRGVLGKGPGKKGGLELHRQCNRGEERATWAAAHSHTRTHIILCLPLPCGFRGCMLGIGIAGREWMTDSAQYERFSSEPVCGTVDSNKWHPSHGVWARMAMHSHTALRFLCRRVWRSPVVCDVHSNDHIGRAHGISFSEWIIFNVGSRYWCTGMQNNVRANESTRTTWRDSWLRYSVDELGLRSRQDNTAQEMKLVNDIDKRSEGRGNEA